MRRSVPSLSTTVSVRFLRSALMEFMVFSGTGRGLVWVRVKGDLVCMLVIQTIKGK